MFLIEQNNPRIITVHIKSQSGWILSNQVPN